MMAWRSGVCVLASTVLIAAIIKHSSALHWAWSVINALQTKETVAVQRKRKGGLPGKDSSRNNQLPDIEDLAASSACCAHAERSVPGLQSTQRKHGTHAPSEGIYGEGGVRMIHLEITDKCNAACPQCARNRNGGATNPLLPLVELSVRDVKAMFKTQDLASIRKIYLCGNYGDPCSARECLQILEYLRGANPKMIVGLHTNGGARSAEWWAKAGQLLRAPSYARFAIDGLEDTNHLYRQHVKWPALIRNLNAFVAAGGEAQWDFLAFRHNQHQVEQARALSKELGFSKFQVKKTQRFLNWRTGELRDSTPVHNASGQVVRHLQLPSDPALVNTAIALDIQQKVEAFGSMDAYYASCAIACKAQRDKEAYVSAEGYVFPCCWLAGHLYNDTKASDREVLALLRRAGLTLADLRLGAHTSIHDVVTNPLFADALPQSFTKASIASESEPGGGGDRDGRLRTCAKACGSQVNPFAQQFR